MTGRPERVVGFEPRRLVEVGTERIQSATFAPRRLSSGPSRVPLVAGGWMAVLVALAGIAVAGHGVGDRGPVSSPAPPAAMAATGLTLPAGEALGDQTIVQAVRVTSPGPSGAVISRPQVTVTGRVSIRLDHVLVSLEDQRRRQVLAARSINVSDAGGFRPAVQPTFEATFAFPEPRPIGALWIVVTAYDAAGTPVDVVRRAILVTAVTEPPLRILDRTDRPA
jgi:hypothetical protein